GGAESPKGATTPSRAHRADSCPTSTPAALPALPLLTWLALADVMLDCLCKALALYWFVVGPELAPNFPGIQKPLKQPTLVGSMVMVTLPCLLCLGVSKCRTAPRVVFISGIFCCEAVFLLVYGTLVS